MSVDGSFKDKHLWVKKTTGSGVTEFMLRLMAWLCTFKQTNHSGSIGNGQMCIVTGPNIDIAIKLIKRLKGIFDTKLGLTFNDKETVLQLNGYSIEAYPSNHIDSFRALDNPKFILLDESDFWRKSEIDNVRHVAERYIGKSDPYIVMVSTPNAPGGLFERIEKEPEESCLYKRLKMDYHYGIGKIYTIEEIEKAKRKIRILYSEEFEHANPQDIVDLCFSLYRKHWNTWFWVDGANRAFVNLMKVVFSESLSWESSKQGT